MLFVFYLWHVLNTLCNGCTDNIVWFQSINCLWAVFTIYSVWISCIFIKKQYLTENKQNKKKTVQLQKKKKKETPSLT